MAGRAWDQGDKAGLKFAQDAGVNINIVKKSDVIYQEFKQLTEGMDHDFLDLVKNRNVNAEEALDYLRKTAKNYQSNIH